MEPRETRMWIHCRWPVQTATKPLEEPPTVLAHPLAVGSLHFGSQTERGNNASGTASGDARTGYNGTIEIAHLGDRSSKLVRGDLTRPAKYGDASLNGVVSQLIAPLTRSQAETTLRRRLEWQRNRCPNTHGKHKPKQQTRR